MCLYIWYSVAFANAECLFKTNEKKHFQNLMQASSHSFSHCVFFFSKRFLKFNSFQFICYNNNNNSFKLYSFKNNPQKLCLTVWIKLYIKHKFTCPSWQTHSQTYVLTFSHTDTHSTARSKGLKITEKLSYKMSLQQLFKTNCWFRLTQAVTKFWYDNFKSVDPSSLEEWRGCLLE